MLNFFERKVFVEIGGFGPVALLNKRVDVGVVMGRLPRGLFNREVEPLDEHHFDPILFLDVEDFFWDVFVLNHQLVKGIK